ncbi:hypothetical protein [Mesorhizobium sp. A623]
MALATLTGGAGTDTLTGGTGNDTFSGTASELDGTRSLTCRSTIQFSLRAGAHLKVGAIL